MVPIVNGRDLALRVFGALIGILVFLGQTLSRGLDNMNGQSNDNVL